MSITNWFKSNTSLLSFYGIEHVYSLLCRMIHSTQISKKFKGRIIGIILFLLVGGSINAQDAIVSAGKNVAGASGDFTYSVGQSFAATYSSSSGHFQIGILGVMKVLVEPLSASSEKIKFSVYPNPASEDVKLQLDMDLVNPSYQLHDMEGKQVANAIIKQETSQIDIRDIPAGTYLLTVLENGSPLQKFRVIKN